MRSITRLLIGFVLVAVACSAPTGSGSLTSGRSGVGSPEVSSSPSASLGLEDVQRFVDAERAKAAKKNGNGTPATTPMSKLVQDGQYCQEQQSEKYRDRPYPDKRQLDREWDECIKERGGSTSSSFASSSTHEPVSLREAGEWFKFRPLLFASEPIAPGLRQVVYASSDKGGRKGNPNSDLCVVNIAYESPDASSKDTSFGGVLAGGGVWVVSGVVPKSATYRSGDGEPVVVRGQPGVLAEYSGRIELSWETRRGDGSRLVWRVLGSKDFYSPQRLQEWTESLSSLP